MPDVRLIHRRMLRGDRIAALTDFERGVWLAYELLADDYGVMRLSAVDLQKACWLEKRPRKMVQRGFERLVTVGLIASFKDGERTYAFQPDWQSWQSVRHPRGTIEPCPPIPALEICDRETQDLFRTHHPRCPAAFVLKDIRTPAEPLREDSGNPPAPLPQDSGNSPETLRGISRLARAGRRELLTANSKQLTAHGGGGTGEPRPMAFDGRVLHVSRKMHRLLGDMLGGEAGTVDLLARYPEWDEELARTGEPHDPLAWMKARAFERVAAAKPQVSKLTAALARSDADFLRSGS